MTLPPGVTEEFMRALERRAQRQAAFNPPDIDKYEAGIIIGITTGPIPDGSAEGECDHCHEVITIGPGQQKALALRPDLTALCMACAMACVMLGYRPSGLVQTSGLGCLG